MNKEYILSGKNLNARIHKTDDIWLMYINDDTNPFFDKTKKKLVAIFEVIDKDPKIYAKMQA